MMLPKSAMHNYQLHAAQFILDNPYCALFMEMGLGKTISTLTAIDELMYKDFEINKVLIIAPKNAAESVWDGEINNWQHVSHLKYSLIIGDESKRKKALKQKADVYVIGRDNITWLITTLGGAWPFDMLVIDELSSFKNRDAMRFKALRLQRPKIKRVIGLTGTPAGNGMIDLWAEMYLIDMGERLGKTITEFRVAYFKPGQTSGHIVYNYELKDKTCEQKIFDRIRDIVISMKSEDYLELPEVIYHDIKIKLPEALQKKYDEFEEEQVLRFLSSLYVDEQGLHEQTEISAVTAAALTTKLLQFANGAIYDEDHNYHVIHDEKLKALGEILETSEQQNVLVFYSFRHDLDRIQKKYPHAVLLKGKKEINDWNSGKIKLMIAHAASAGHGLNLQAGGHIIVWFGIPWSLELYQQANKRLHRQGQKQPVLIYKLIVKKTMDVHVANDKVSKAQRQDMLMDAVKAIVNKYQTS